MDTTKLRNLLLLSILCLACKTSKIDHSFIPVEFYFPADQIGEGKTFTYVDESSGDKTYLDYYHGYENNKKYLIQKAYSLQGTNDSLIYLDYQLIETYSYMFSDKEPTKGDIQQDTVIENGKKLGKNIRKVAFQTDSTLLTIISESEYVKDTIFSWKGTLLPTLVIKTTYNSSIKSKLHSEPPTDFRIEFLTYEAKGTGTIRIRMLTTQDKRVKNIDLIKIGNRQI